MSFPFRISLSFVKLLPYNIHVYLLIATMLKFINLIRMESVELWKKRESKSPVNNNNGEER
jgi:hypothetical protein